LVGYATSRTVDGCMIRIQATGCNAMLQFPNLMCWGT